MSRPKIKTEDKKTKNGISISIDVKNKLNSISNKSIFIENLIIEYFKKIY